MTKERLRGGSRVEHLLNSNLFLYLMGDGSRLALFRTIVVERWMPCAS